MRHRRWFVTAGMAVLLGLAPGACGFGDDSPREFVESEYKRAANLDVDGVARAYTSPRTPAAVEDAIVDAWRPLDRAADQTGIYLRFADDVVTVQPNGSGSVIRVEGAGTACPRYRSTVGANWNCDARAEDQRGGGPGDGK